MTDEIKLRYRITRAVRNSTLPSPARLIMLVLADVAEVGTAEIPPQRTPSLSVLAAETGLDRRTIQRHMEALVTAGWIARSVPTATAQGHRQRVQYRLLLPVGTGGIETPVAEDHPTGGTETPDGRQETASRVAESPTADGTEPPPNRSTDETEILEMFEMATPPPKSKKRGSDDDPEFAAFWSHYPHKVGKGQARTAWAKAIKRVDPSVIIAAAEQWAAYCRAQRTEQQFIAHPSTWLNGERWADERAANGRTGPYMNPADQRAAYASGGL